MCGGFQGGGEVGPQVLDVFAADAEVEQAGWDVVLAHPADRRVRRQTAGELAGGVLGLAQSQGEGACAAQRQEAALPDGLSARESSGVGFRQPDGASSSEAGRCEDRAVL